MQRAAVVSFAIPDALWMSSNRPITQHGYRARIVRELHDLAGWTWRASRRGAPPAVATPCTAEWTIHYPAGTGDEVDASNAQPTCKALLDGLVDVGAIPGDGRRHVVRETYTAGPNTTATKPRMHRVTLTLTPTVPPS